VSSDPPGSFFVLSWFRGYCQLSKSLLISLLALAAVGAAPPDRARTASAEAATARRFAVLRNQPLPLIAFLRAMPKGGDLHNHLSGAIYAESYLRWAAEDNMCLATATMTLVVGTCDAAAGQPPVTAVLQNTTLYNQAIDAMSMRHWNPALNGHDHFFATFEKFGAVSTRTGDMIAEVSARAAAEHVSYLELMLTPARAAAARFAREIGWNPDFAALRQRLLAAGFRDAVAAEARQRFDAAEARQKELLRCVRLRSSESARATAGQGAEQPDPGCAVTIRYVAQVGRTGSPEVVFAQLLAGFELALIEPRVVSVNLVQPEDDPNAVANFTLQTSMLEFLHGQYPRVPISLHAGELTAGLVAPETLRFHIRQSIEKGHATRIGHGVSIMDEDDPFGLLRTMASRRVLVEIALTSTEQILGVRGPRHPLGLFLKYGVPVALVTDDAGVSRSTLTQEFVKAVEEHGVDYRTLKQMVRNSLEFAFVDAATKARLKSDLENDFRTFEHQAEPRAPNLEPRTPTPDARPRTP
jgi:adenosine deaminase